MTRYEVFTATLSVAPGVRSSGDVEVLSALRDLGISEAMTSSASEVSPSEDAPAESEENTAGEGEPEATDGSASASRPARSVTDVRAEQDHVYFLRVPAAAVGDEAGRARLQKFADDFLVGDASRLGVLLDGVSLPDRPRDEASIIVMRRPGVMDPVSASVLHALQDAGFDSNDCQVRFARRHRIRTDRAAGRGNVLSRDLLLAVGSGRLANVIVDEFHCFLGGETEQLPDPFRELASDVRGRTEIALRELESGDLVELSRLGGLSLTEDEMVTIRDHFRELDRDPTDAELETLAQTWSEHCCHKTLTGPIDYDGDRVENLLKETIFAATQKIDAPFCWSVFKDNAGVISIDDEWGLSIKVETHNHPSALEPYGGAGTGIGGVIRDTLGTGLGALPVLSTDVFCFGPLDAASDHLPPGAQHPKRLLSGVVAGVRDYGNRMGIPTANGALFFHPGYIGNPLVFCGSVGLIPRDKVEKTVAPGDLIVAIGGRTGRDGIHGATFSSRELTEESESVSSGAVQIGNPIEEKKVLDALLRARDAGLYRGLTDCGAGGFSSAVGEMGEDVGARVDLERAPLKYEGLSPCEIWISEAQERMVLAVPPENKAALFEILDEEEVEGCVLGEFTGDQQLRLFYHGELMGELSMKFLHDGRPNTERKATRSTPAPQADPDLQDSDWVAVLRAHVEHPNIASKEAIIRQYDHEVQGRMVVRPLTGEETDGPNDGAAFDPLRNGQHTVVVGCGMQPLLGEIDPYQMGAQAVDEAIRNVLVSGGSLDRMALLDNFAWGNVHDPEILGALIECSRGAADAAIGYGSPFVSGKDSLHNTFRAGGVSRSIPHTLLVTAVSVVPGSPRAPSSDLKANDSVLVLLGLQSASIAGSTAQLIFGGVGGEPNRFDATIGTEMAAVLERWQIAGRVRSCHDLSDGGLVVAAAEMAFGARGIGVDLDLELSKSQMERFAALFGEAPHRFLLELSRSDAETLIREVPVTSGELGYGARVVGQTNDSATMLVRSGGEILIDDSITELRDLWKAPLTAVWPEVTA